VFAILWKMASAEEVEVIRSAVDSNVRNRAEICHDILSLHRSMPDKTVTVIYFIFTEYTQHSV